MGMFQIVHGFDRGSLVTRLWFVRPEINRPEVLGKEGRY